MPMLGSNRTTAIGQLLGLVYLVTIYPIVLAIGLVGGLIFMLGDVIRKLILDKPAGGDTISMWAMRLFNWPVEQLYWIINGDGSFQFLP